MTAIATAHILYLVAWLGDGGQPVQFVVSRFSWWMRQGNEIRCNDCAHGLTRNAKFSVPATRSSVSHLLQNAFLMLMHFTAKIVFLRCWKMVTKNNVTVMYEMNWFMQKATQSSKKWNVPLVRSNHTVNVIKGCWVPLHLPLPISFTWRAVQDFSKKIRCLGPVGS